MNPKLTWLALGLAGLGLLAAGCVADNNAGEQLAGTLGPDAAPVFAGISEISGVSSSTFQAEWLPADDDNTPGPEIVYALYWATTSGGQDFSTPNNTVVGKSFHLQNGLTGDTPYCVVIRARDGGGNEDANTEEICVQTLPAPIDNAPPVFAGLEAITDVHATSFLLSWQPADDETTPGSQILYSAYLASLPGGQNFATPTATTTGATFRQMNGLTPGTQYCTVVRAKDGLGNEDTNTAEICGTTPLDTTPPSFGGAGSASLTQVSPPQVTLGWSMAFDDNTPAAQITYAIFRAEVPGGQNFATPLDTVVGTAGFVDATVAENKTYHYVVRARDALGNEDGNTQQVAVSTPFASAGVTYGYYPGLHDLGNMGSSVALVDWDGDGFLDIAAGAYNTGNPTAAGTAAYRAGQVSIYLGLGDGTFEKDPGVQFYSPNPAANGFFGRALAACDIAGDGTADDLVVGASGEQRAYVYLNTVSGMDTTADRVINAPSGQGDTDNFGESLACANVNGVGGDDLVVGAPYSDNNGATNSGTLFFYNNNSVPPVIDLAGPNASYFFFPQDDFVAQIPDSNQPLCGEGLVLQDLDGDGALDLAVGCPGADFAGANDGLVVFYRRPDFTDANSWVTASYALPPNNDDYWGWALAAGNLDDADPGLELVVGQTLHDSPGVNAGAVYFYDVAYGAGSFSLTQPWRVITDRGPNGSYAAFGAGLAVGDVLGDGADDLVVGAPEEDFAFHGGNLTANIGALYLFGGTVGGAMDAIPEQADFNTIAAQDGTPVHGGAYDIRFGSAICTGDINNDGRADLLVGAENDPTDGKESSVNGTGRVYVWYGVATGEMDLAAPPNDYFPAPGFVPGKRFGSSCLVMDFNNDGRNDVVVGAQYADDAAADQGAVYIYLGVPSPNLGGADTGSVIPDATPEETLYIPEAPGTASHYFGSALAGCDLTGDGFPELMVGARQFDGATAENGITPRGSTNEGAVFVFAGGAQGIVPADYQVIFPTDLDVGLSSYGAAAFSDNNFGYAIGCFPSVGGSAAMDLVVGAPLAQRPGGNANQGMVAVFYGVGNQDPTVSGSCSGSDEYVGSVCLMDDTRDIRIDDQGTLANDDSLFGSAIAVGDWDGSGGPDLVVGAYRARNPAPEPNNNGGVYAFRGAAAGGFIDLSSGVPLSTLSLIDPSNYSDNGFADGALALEDLNNNGIPDLIVGVRLCTYNDPVKKHRGTGTGCLYIDRGDYRP